MAEPTLGRTFFAATVASRPKGAEGRPVVFAPEVSGPPGTAAAAVPLADDNGGVIRFIHPRAFALNSAAMQSSSVSPKVATPRDASRKDSSGGYRVAKSAVVRSADQPKTSTQ